MVVTKEFFGKISIFLAQPLDVMEKSIFSNDPQAYKWWNDVGIDECIIL